VIGFDSIWGVEEGEDQAAVRRLTVYLHHRDTAIMRTIE
jgi:hypothetical protein